MTQAPLLGWRDAAVAARVSEERPETPVGVVAADELEAQETSTPSAPQASAESAWKWEESDDALRTYGALAGVLALGTLPGLRDFDAADLPYFISLALLTIYIGAHRGLTTTQRQMISIKEGALAPLAASVSLSLCYVLVKFFPDFSLQGFLNAYFWLLGSVAAVGASGPVLRRLGGPLGQPTLGIDVPEGLLLDESTGAPVTRAEFAQSDVVALAGSLALASAEVASNHANFTLNNAVACLVASDILQLVGLRSFRTAGLMLAGLLAYDVFWVFGSPKVLGDNVMLAVATSDILTGPVRLLFPREPGGTGEASGFGFSLLGLGDIAIPGLLACLALRYDASRAVDMGGRARAAAGALLGSLSAADPGSSSTKVATDAADAAELAYDKFADRELRQRDRSLVDEGASAPSSAAGGPRAAGGAGGTQPTAGSAPPPPPPPALEARLPVSDAVLQQRPYFDTVAAAYVVGLLTAFGANAVTHLGQPALLYIVPATLGAVVARGLSRDELYRVWQYTDVPTYGMPAELLKKADKYDEEQAKKK